MLTRIQQVETLIAQGRPLVLSGEEELLRSLPKGNWVGGTIPYFMAEAGGQVSKDQIFVQVLPESVTETRVIVYGEDNIAHIAKDSPEHGLSLLLLPAFSKLHEAYALNAPNYPELFMRVIGGFIAGVHLDELTTKKPAVFNGQTGEVYTDQAVALHAQLAPGFAASLGIVNIFEQGEGAEISFPNNGFEVHDCIINGEKRNFHDYLTEQKINLEFPLIADVFGTRVNVSFQALDTPSKKVKLYAPVFEGVKYKLARPLADYSTSFACAIPPNLDPPSFACNCILNFLFGKLEGSHTGNIVGPMTFGEVGYQLLNQTMVYITIEQQSA